MKRKLYDYLEGGLTEVDQSAVRKHLEVCPRCGQVLSRMRGVIALTRQRTEPQPSEAFWHEFQAGLDRKLNARLVPDFKPEPKPAYTAKPVLAYTAALAVILLVGSYVFLSQGPGRFAGSDIALVNDIEFLEDTSPESTLNHDELAYIDELDTFYQLGQNPS